MCKKTATIYGYARVSTKQQNIDRQIRNIKSAYPDAVIRQEKYTGTKLDGRKELDAILKVVQPGDTIVFDSVSRMSRNAEEGFKLYEKLYNDNVNLVFLKEPHINTAVYKTALQNQIEMTGNEIADMYIETTNRVLLVLAKDQIRLAFEASEKEVLDLRQRTKEGIETARINGKQIGGVEGRKLNVKKAAPAKQRILELSRSFNGTLKDKDVMKLIGIANNTYYKYKKELYAELAAEAESETEE